MRRSELRNQTMPHERIAMCDQCMSYPGRGHANDSFGAMSPGSPTMCICRDPR